MDMPNWLRGWETVWPHHTSLPSLGHRLVTFTTMLLNGPEYDGVYGSLFEVILKQRPQASPEAELAPNANVLTAAVYPDVFMPHAVKRRHGQRGLWSTKP